MIDESKMVAEPRSSGSLIGALNIFYAFYGLYFFDEVFENLFAFDANNEVAVEEAVVGVYGDAAQRGAALF